MSRFFSHPRLFAFPIGGCRGVACRPCGISSVTVAGPSAMFIVRHFPLRLLLRCFVCVCVCVGLLIWNPTESSRWEPGTNSKRNKKKRNNNRKINLRRDLTEFSPPRCGPLDFFLSGIVSNYEKLNSTECTLLLHPIQSLFRFEGSSAGSSGRLRRVLIQQWYR